MKKDGVFEEYLTLKGFHDEVFDNKSVVRPLYKELWHHFMQYNHPEFLKLNEDAKTSMFNQGITFSVYSEDNAQEKIFPFDLFPRLIPKSEWVDLEKGALQRATALNLFIKDLYNKKQILKDEVVPLNLIATSQNYLKQMTDFIPPGGIYNHITGTDLIKHNDGKYYVLEDNLRTPSGVSYVLNNRQAITRTLVGVFNKFNPHAVNGYPDELKKILNSVKPQGVDNPNCVLLTPGIYNSAYFEHTFLATSMGINLVEGRDLFVEKDFVYQKTIHGSEKVDIMYRRVDDAFLDPLTFNPNSMLGIPGLMSAYRAGNITIVNAPGTGVADDKAVYAYVPEIIKYYLDEEPILNNVPTYHCENKDHLKYVLDNISNLVIKPVDESGGYGISIGSKLTKAEIEIVKNQINAFPRKYVAQPIMSLSLHSTYIENEKKFKPRHVDLRTFTLLGKDKSFVLKGGLTRVALKEGNLIVNSSQGGGSKDTWIVD